MLQRGYSRRGAHPRCRAAGATWQAQQASLTRDAWAQPFLCATLKLLSGSVIRKFMLSCAAGCGRSLLLVVWYVTVLTAMQTGGLDVCTGLLRNAACRHFTVNAAVLGSGGLAHATMAACVLC
jgi:hypothetical protein